MTIIDFIEDNKITDRDKIKAAVGMPESMPDSFLPKSLFPIGCGKYKGDGLPGTWTKDGQLECGRVYPIYHFEGQRLVIGKNDKGLKLNTQDWKEIVWF